MPYTWNGCGTKYYGKREPAIDGSYIATEWIVLAFLPLIPIGSFRIQPSGRSSWFFFYSSKEYYVTRVPFNGRQIRNTYLVLVGIFAGLQVGLPLLNYAIGTPSTSPQFLPMGKPTNSPKSP